MDAQLRLMSREDPSRDDAEVPTPARARRAVRPAEEPVEAPLRWRIDDSARERGRAGITQAREALRRARRPMADDPHTTAA